MRLHRVNILLHVRRQRLHRRLERRTPGSSEASEPPGQAWHDPVEDVVAVAGVAGAG